MPTPRPQATMAAETKEKRMTETQDPTCQTCDWYKPAFSERHGFCKRLPPVFAGMGENGFPRFYQPTVSLTGFCGEHQDFEEIS